MNFVNKKFGGFFPNRQNECIRAPHYTLLPELLVVDKKKRSCKIIDFAVPGDSRIEEKEKDKIEKYQDLGREIQKIWNVKVKMIQ